MKITIIGSGNVATVLAKTMFSKGHTIVNIAARDEDAGKALANIVQANYTKINALDKSVDIIIIAVADKSIGEIASQLDKTNAIVVHTAGSVSIDLLQNKFDNYGVIYPLQSLRKDMVDIPEIPFLLEANNSFTSSILNTFCKSLSNTVSFITENERLYLHTSAVFVNNFTNYLYSEVYQLCQDNKINFNLLLPLIKETANRVEHQSPLDMQTGPAKRNDTVTIEKHLKLLDKYPKVKEIYAFISERITKMYS
jgi:predicted short-subunit dehydrogenase-like oxidoreductase (DUF2520 family)